VRCLNNTPPCETESTTLVEVIDNVVPGRIPNVLRSRRSGNDVVLSWSALLGEPISGYRLYKDANKPVLVGSRTLISEPVAVETTSVDIGGVVEVPVPRAYYQVVGVSCAGDLEGPY
jgi:hypothetical protein